MARRSSKSVRYDDDLVELPIDGLPARVEPSYFDLRGKVVQARKDLTSYHALVRKAILAGRKEGYSNKRIARELGCDASHVGRVIKADLLREEVARRRPDFPINRISDSKWEILASALAGAPEAQLDELLEAAEGLSVEDLRQKVRDLRPSGAQAYGQRSRRQASGAVESHADCALRLSVETGLSKFFAARPDRAELARALIRYEHEISVAREGVAMATDAK